MESLLKVYVNKCKPIPVNQLEKLNNDLLFTYLRKYDEDDFHKHLRFIYDLNDIRLIDFFYSKYDKINKLSKSKLIFDMFFENEYYNEQKIYILEKYLKENNFEINIRYNRFLSNIHNLSNKTIDNIIDANFDKISKIRNVNDSLLYQLLLTFYKYDTWNKVFRYNKRRREYFINYILKKYINDKEILNILKICIHFFLIEFNGYLLYSFINDYINELIKNSNIKFVDEFITGFLLHISLNYLSSSGFIIFDNIIENDKFIFTDINYSYLLWGLDNLDKSYKGNEKEKILQKLKENNRLNLSGYAIHDNSDIFSIDKFY